MNANHKLRKVIIAVCAVMGASYTLHAKAIGLGDIHVSSHLGEQLSATIPVMGILKASDIDCFRVNNEASSPELYGTRFKFTNLVGENATLVLNTSQAISEPIANLSIIAECQTQPKITREYTLLIDPNTSNINIAEVEPQNSFNNNTVLANVSSAVGSNAKNGSDNAIVADTSKQQVKKLRRKAKSKRTNAAPLNTQTASGQKEIDLKYPETSKNQQTAAKNNASAQVERPRLSISSGGDFLATGSANINLVLEKNLDLGRAAPVGVNVADIEMQDEVTVMNNRLEHLGKLITGLQSRNKELETKDKMRTAEMEQATQTTNRLRNISYGLILGSLLTIGYVAANWWRRRKQVKALHNEETLWSSLKADNELQVDEQLKNINDKLDNEIDEFDDIENDNFGTEVSFIKETPEEDILDHADVFLSHGRSTLAIQLLQNHLADRPKDSANIWLFLLDLLAKENLEDEYNAATIECRKYFNVAIPSFTAPCGNPNSFESYDRLSAQLQKVWGTPEATKFLDDLIYNTRLEPRIGFEKEIFEELVLLRGIAIEEEKSAEVIQFQDKKTARDERKQARDNKTVQQISMVDAVDEVPTLPEVSAKFTIKETSFDSDLEMIGEGNFAPDLDFSIEPVKKVASKNVNKIVDEQLYENGFEFELDNINTSAFR